MRASLLVLAMVTTFMLIAGGTAAVAAPPQQQDVAGTRQGTLSADGASISGTWTQRAPLTLVLQRANDRTAWPLDPSPHNVRFVTVDHDVKLEYPS